MFFVGFDYILNELMSDHITLVEPDYLNIVDILENLYGVDKTAAPAVGQVYLGYIARDHHLRVEAETGQKHLHLLNRGVLRLVEDNEAVVKRASAHIGEGRDFYVAALELLLEAFSAEHIEQSVVERAQIRVNLLLQVAGQEAELLARFDCGAGEDYAVDLLCAKGGDRHGNR